jgi:CheY-like chemotaxis protein
MRMKIIILEDNAERRDAMRACLEDRFHQYEIRFSTSAQEAIDDLRTHWDDILAIALDHDLELEDDGNGGLIDPGTGREVADFLAERQPICPVILHTTNGPAAVGMEAVLRDAGWTSYRVVPYDDLEWVSEDWFGTMRKALVGSVTHSQKLSIEANP